MSALREIVRHLAAAHKEAIGHSSLQGEIYVLWDKAEKQLAALEKEAE